MPQVRLTRAVRFTAHHRLHDPALSAEENRAAFGATVDPHSHDYRVEVTVAGAAPEPRAMVMDLVELDRLLEEEIVSRLRGTHLHRDIDAFHQVLPTCEALARHLFGRLAPRLPAGVTLARVMVAEDDSLSAECLPDR